MTRAVVLGCGLIGRAMTLDLARDSEYEVTVADANEASLEALRHRPAVHCVRADLGDPVRVRDLVSGYDVVLGALPSALGLATLRAVIETSVPYADISFMPEDPLTLDELARGRGVTAVVDCGVAPGFANLIVGHCVAQLDRAEWIEYYVGGLPKPRIWPYQYRATFAPLDVIEEYTRPARMVEEGNFVVKPALSEPELIDFGRVGALEAFNTDGLRTLLRTIRAPHLKEKTLRYPGHRDLMLVLRESGFFDKRKIDGVGISPLELTSRLIFPMWQRPPEEDEFTVLRVIVEGRKDGRRRRYTYDLYAELDRETGESSMARTTGYTCTTIARMLARGDLRQTGVLAPEQLGAIEGVLPRVAEALKERRISIDERIEEIS
jgi:saccharopine dehydrogenase-like NADP-dependent oxidoreductase